MQHFGTVAELRAEVKKLYTKLTLTDSYISKTSVIFIQVLYRSFDKDLIDSLAFHVQGVRG